MFIGWGKVINTDCRNYIYLDVTNTSTFNTIQNIRKQFDTLIEDFPIIKIDKDKVWLTILNNVNAVWSR